MISSSAEYLEDLEYLLFDELLSTNDALERRLELIAQAEAEGDDDEVPCAETRAFLAQYHARIIERLNEKAALFDQVEPVIEAALSLYETHHSGQEVTLPQLLEEAGQPSLLELGISPRLTAEAFCVMAGNHNLKPHVPGGLDYLLTTPLSASFTLWMNLGITRMSVNPDDVIETMILDVEEENGVEYEWE